MPELMELTPAPEIFCSGLGKIERLEGGNMRFWLYASQTPPGGAAERVVVARIVIPASAVPDIILMTIAAMGGDATAGYDPTRLTQ